MFYADIKTLQVITIMSVMHVDIICIACRRNRRSGLVGRAFASHAEDLGSIPGCDGPKSFKQIVTAQLSNAWQQVLVLRVLRDDHVNSVTVDVATGKLKNPHSSILGAEYTCSSKFEALHW